MSSGLPPVPTSDGQKGRTSIIGYIREEDAPDRKSSNYLPTISTPWMRLRLNINRQVV